MDHGRIKVFATTTGRTLAAKVCEHLSIDLGRATVSRFSDGEVNIQLLEDVRGCDVFIVGPTNPPAENILEMVFLSHAARGSSADRVTLVPVYLGYNRQDRKDRPRVPITASIVIEMLGRTNADRALLFDLHSEPTMALFHQLGVTVDHLYASAVSVPYLRSILKGPFVVASPDKGGAPRANAYARLLGQEDFVLFAKVREKAGTVVHSSIKIIGDVRGRDVVFVDDMVDTAGTLIAGAAAAKRAGARKVYAFATHALLSKDAVARLDASKINELIVTDSIPHAPEHLATKRIKVTVLSVGAFIAKAIRRIHDQESLSALINSTR